MPNNTPQQPQSQAPMQMSQNMQPTQGGQPQGKEINPEKMLVQMLKEMEQNIEDLSQRVDVLEQKGHTDTEAE